MRWAGKLAWLMAVGLCNLAVGGGAIAQAPDYAGVHTLHAYTNLVQVPTLVLGHDRKPITGIDEHRFYVSLDGGPKLRATYARVEGDDALSVALLLDVSQSDPRILASAGEAIASLAPQSLHAKDEVSIYAMDCRLIHPTDQGGTDAATLKRHVDVALQRSQPRNGRGAKCQDPANLRDSLVTLVEKLSAQPGRRVILVLTDGADRGSHYSWSALTDAAQGRSVAIFGLVQPADYVYSAIGQSEFPFNATCELSGGLLLTASAKDLGKQLAWVLTLIRGRYIVEFPRPMSTVGGYHNLEITIPKMWALIRPTGADVPTVDPDILKDPTTVPSDPSLAPQLGNRRILSPK